MDEVDLGVAFWRAAGGVDVVSAEITAELEGLLDGQIAEVLVAEGDDLALGNEAGELVFAGVAEGGELDALDFGANGWGEVGDGCALREKVGEGWVRVFAVLVMLKRLEWGVLVVGVPSWEVVRVLGDGKVSNAKARHEVQRCIDGIPWRLCGPSGRLQHPYRTWLWQSPCTDPWWR